MLSRYFQPKTVDQILASWIGQLIERHVIALSEKGYSRTSILNHVQVLRRFSDFARSRGVSDPAGLATLLNPFMEFSVKRHAPECRSAAGRCGHEMHVVGAVRSFLALTLPVPPAPAPPWPFADRAPGFLDYLVRERGLTPMTIQGYRHHLVRFDAFLKERGVVALDKLAPPLLSQFMMSGRGGAWYRGGRASTLRTFLRYLSRERLCPKNLAKAVDGPRHYQLASVPRSITKEEVGRVLALVDRRTAVGKRDYAVLLLLSSYGLRAREIAALRLEDIEWDRDRLRIPQRKAGHSTMYPLSTDVGEAVIDYLRAGRGQSKERRIFLAVRPPFHPLPFYAIANLAGRALDRAGIVVRRPGSHTFRHTCVQRLVDADVPFKVIGDYVGHRTPASTRIYGKVAIEALREITIGDGEEIL